MPGKRKKKTVGSKDTRIASGVVQLSFAEVDKWEIPPIRGNAVEIDALPSPIWTETKAQLIANYLRLFLLITKHGVYIDGFSGPQVRQNPDSWAAKLVLELSPPWMKSFFLCELNRNSYGDLISMIEAHPKVSGRQINHQHGDFNQWVDDGWRQVEGIGQNDAATLYLGKIQALGYRDVKSWPISAREGGIGRTMYHMIHATDHLEAPKLMYRAYRNLIGNVPAGEQTQFAFDTAPT